MLTKKRRFKYDSKLSNKYFNSHISLIVLNNYFKKMLFTMENIDSHTMDDVSVSAVPRRWVEQIAQVSDTACPARSGQYLKHTQWDQHC